MFFSNRKKRNIYCLFASFLIITLCASAEEYKTFRIGFHLDSNISGGRYSPETLVQKAKLQGLDAVIFCDHDRFEVEYGIPPLRNLLRKKIIQPSISTFGFNRYFSLLDSLDQAEPEITIIPGLEINPLYYWSGDPFKRIVREGFTLDKLTFRDLKLNNWHQHLMVIGLDNPQQYASLPATASKLRYDYDYYFRYIRQKGINHLFELRIWVDFAALLGILSSFCLFFKKRSSKVDFYGQVYKVKRKPFRKTGIVLFVFSALILINDYPFTPWMYSPYDEHNRAEATQALIDSALSGGGLIFFAHPEAAYSGSFGGVKALTNPYAGLLPETENYTGFAVFAEGYEVAGTPGGIWDKVLLQYCQGERRKPVWAVGELDFEGDLPDDFLNEVGTFVWAEENSRHSILKALSSGRCCASQHFAPQMIHLEQWMICPQGDVKQKAVSGETLSTDKSLTIKIGFELLSSIDQSGKPVYYNLLIIRNGETIDTLSFDKSLELDYEDNPPPGKNFYRLWVLKGETDPILASNPIFVENPQ